MKRALIIAAVALGVLLAATFIRSQLARDGCDDIGGTWVDGRCIL